MWSKGELFIDGQWTAPAGQEWIEVRNPHDGRRIGRVAGASIADADRSVIAAAQALPMWSATAPGKRASCLERMADWLEAHIDTVTEVIVAEVGMPVRQARRVQVELPIRNLRNHARHLRTFSFSHAVNHSRVERVPCGVVVAITPWNYPLHQIVLKVAGALAAGCTVVLKPSEITPLNAGFLADAALHAGLPPGVLNVVPGTGTAVGEALIRHPLVDKISFTGSTAVGKIIAATAGNLLKRTTLELGGKSASVLLPDANIEQAIKRTVASCMLNSGQTCTALTRLLVPAELQDAVAARAADLINAMEVGDPRLKSTRIGPLTTRSQQQRVSAYIERGLGEGARLQSGGLAPPSDVPHGGYYVRPTLFSHVDRRMSIAREEIFGPVLCIMPYEDEADALAIAEATEFGLAGAVWAESVERAEAFARHMRAGQIEVNGGMYDIDAPFGGFGHSGYGREGGVYGIEDFLEYRAIQYPIGSSGHANQEKK